MPKRSLIDQLDQAVQAVLVQPRGQEAQPPMELDASVVPLLRIAQNLRDLPREDFKLRLKSDLERRSSMASAAPIIQRMKGVPEGFHTATPYLCFKNAGAAIEFYKRAFGAIEVMRLKGPGEKIGHAEIRIGDSPIMLSDEFPEYGAISAETLGGAAVKISLFVEDVDAVARQAIAAGARVVRPVQDQFYGERSGQFADPFGYTWIVGTHKETMSAEEMQRRLDALMAQEGGAAKSEEAPKGTGVVPSGFHTIAPYIIVPRAGEFIEFLKNAFDGVERFRVGREPGSEFIMHAEVTIGNSTIELADANEQYAPAPTAIHLYVDEADAVFAQAVEAGATSIYEVGEHVSGDRQGAVRDPFGNLWYIAMIQGWTPGPEGVPSIQPYLHLRGSEKMIPFLENAFGGVVQGHVPRSPEGHVLHATVQIGDNTLELDEAHGEFRPMPCHLHLHIDDADAMYRRAIRAGATSIDPPSNKPYGRSGRVKDPFGNSWYMTSPLEPKA